MDPWQGAWREGQRMRNPVMVVTLEVCGRDEETMLFYHDQLRACLRRWADTLVCGEVHIAYQEDLAPRSEEAPGVDGGAV